MCIGCCLLVQLQARLFTCSASSVLARQCLDQLILVNRQVERVITNRHAQHRLSDWSCLVIVECFYCCVVDCNHCVLPCCCCVLYACIIPSVSSIVKPNQGLFPSFLRLDLAPSLPLEATVKPKPYDCHCCCHADCK